jgi:hypothetical protein
MMTNLEAIDHRRSRRLYLQTPIAPEKLVVLKQLIERFNKESDLSIRFVEDGSAAFGSLRKSYGLFSGVKSLLAMIGKKKDVDLKEKMGYYGELLVLEATGMGLGTCWVGGTFDRESAIVELAEGEMLACVIPVGNVEDLSFKEKMVHQMVARKSKAIGEMLVSDVKMPEWLTGGMIAVQKAPSAVNNQPVRFEYKSGALTATVVDDGKFNLIDFGIAKAHFELATGGRFERGNPAGFVL